MALVLAVATATVAALALRLPGLVSTLLAGYVALVADLAAVTWVVSPFHAATYWGLAIAQAIVLVVTVGVWWWRGRPTVPVALPLRELDAVTIAFLAVAAIALAYELALALTVPPTNFDSLTYHLPRVAAWQQEHGIHWIANAPTARMNEFQPLAEQLILFLFVATKTTVVYALPQYVAQLAIVLGVYGVARRLGYGVRAAAASAALVATFSLVALEATTAQNDLVAASFPLVAAYFLLGVAPVEPVLAGVAVGIGAGVKLTTVLVLPLLVWLAWRRLGRFAAGTVAGFVVCSLWGYVLNLVHTGHVLGHGQGRVENTHGFGIWTTIRTAAHLVLRLFDLDKLATWEIYALAGVGVVLVLALRRVLPGVPLVAPLVVLGVLALFSGYDPSYVSRDANEDYAAFGPLGAVALIGACVLAWRRDRRKLALALSLPVYIVLLASYADYNIWITRFLLVPAVLVAPLTAAFLRTRLVVATTAVVAAIVVGLTLAHDRTRPLNGPSGRPWNLTQASALAESPARHEGQELAATVTALAHRVPAGACVGAVLDPDEPSYLLWGPGLTRRVSFLPSLTAVQAAVAAGVPYVVISTGVNAPVADQFRAAGWRVGPLGPYWQLAAIVRPLRGCSSVG